MLKYKVVIKVILLLYKCIIDNTFFYALITTSYVNNYEKRCILIFIITLMLDTTRSFFEVCKRWISFEEEKGR